MNFDLSQFANVRSLSGKDQYICKCPSHDDKTSSLTIKFIDDRILLHCFAGCDTESIVSSIGLTINDLFYDKPAKAVIKRAKQARSGRELFIKDYLYWYWFMHTMINVTKEQRKLFREVKIRLSKIDEDINEVYQRFLKEDYLEIQHKKVKREFEAELQTRGII